MILPPQIINFNYISHLDSVNQEILVKMPEKISGYLVKKGFSPGPTGVARFFQKKTVDPPVCGKHRFVYFSTYSSTDGWQRRS